MQKHAIIPTRTQYKKGTFVYQKFLFCWAHRMKMQLEYLVKYSKAVNIPLAEGDYLF